MKSALALAVPSTISGMAGPKPAVVAFAIVATMACVMTQSAHVADSIAPTTRPATQPALNASAARILAEFAADTSPAFNMGIHYRFPEPYTPSKPGDRRYISVDLLSRAYAADGMRREIASVTPAQLRQIVRIMAERGWLDGVRERTRGDWQRGGSRGPGYVVYLQGARQLYEIDLGWGLPMLQRLQAVRGQLDGRGAQVMDLLLAALEPERKQWEAATRPSGH